MSSTQLQLLIFNIYQKKNSKTFINLEPFNCRFENDLDFQNRLSYTKEKYKRNSKEIKGDCRENLLYYLWKFIISYHGSNITERRVRE